MPQVLENIIVGAVADPKLKTVTLAWASGGTTDSHFDHLVGKGVFAALADPAFFAQVRVGERGRSLNWHGEIDLCADALWFASTQKMRRRRRSARLIPQHSTQLVES